MMTNTRIAIVGIGLRYPDASSTDELWNNILAGRRAFRRLPDERMNHADYWSADPEAPDRFYSTKAAVLRDFEFDRLKYKIAGSTFRSTDMTHWLALDVASQALADAGFPQGDGLPRRTTGVVVGNSLTGEFTRANLMRLRWPYVRRTIAAALSAKGWQDTEIGDVLTDMEARYKAPFPPIDEDTLAGGLANTIAGRICNYFDLAGGGYTVDGACSSSLLSVATAARSLVEGDLDVALAGGVDLSIDPFEVIGFAKTGALATGEMKVYDRDSNGFWPGEGSGIVVLMREEDARAQDKRIYATITGWGVSSDGRGGITRPEESGHRLAIARSYARAGYDVSTVSYFEGHGTGTALGDATEIEALSTARRQADANAPKAALSSVKGLFGHTKAAAGVAGLIKAALSVHHQVIPPGTGQQVPHPLLHSDDAVMFVPKEARLWPQDTPIRAGVSAMGFGGINTHLAVEQAPGVARRSDLACGTVEVVAGRQDCEILLFDATDAAALCAKAARLATLAGTLSFAELSDLAHTLAGELAGHPWRAAVVASAPEDADRKLTKLVALLNAGQTVVFQPRDGIFAGRSAAAPKITFLFPGQGSGSGQVGAIRRRFPVAEDIFRAANVSDTGDQVATEVAQPRIVAGSLATLRVLDSLGVTATTAVGHSLGELTALSWGGAMGDAQLLRLAAIRGRVMADASRGGGAMVGLATTPEKARQLATGLDVVIAGYNGPEQTVLSGSSASVELVSKKALAEGVTAVPIKVSHAFHSPFVRPAADAMAERLAEMTFRPLTGQMFSTVTGAQLGEDADVRALLRSQVLEPVRFHEAAEKAVAGADLAVEVGPGHVLAGLLSQISPETPVLHTDTDNASLTSLLAVVGAAHVAGTDVDTGALFAQRGVKTLPLDRTFSFLASPCETAPEISEALIAATTATTDDGQESTAQETDGQQTSTLELLRKLAAERVELPLEVVGPETHLLDDLHLSSITVGQIVNQVTRKLGRPALAATPNFATVTIGELGEIIDQLAETAQDGDLNPATEVAGVAPWVRPFAVTYVERPLGPVASGAGNPTADWRLFAPVDHPLAEPIRTALAAAGLGDGVLLCLPPDSDESHVGLFLQAARNVLDRSPGSRFVVVQQGFGASGMAKSLHLESPSTPTTIVELDDVALTGPDAVRLAAERTVSEVAATSGFVAVRYDRDGRRLEPELVPVPLQADQGPSPLTSDDVLLVTGGGKGITAECALAMAADSGAQLALLGRGDPTTDTELAANLTRFEAAGVRYTYERADINSAEDVAHAVAFAEDVLGPVTAILHGAGRNKPEPLTSLTEQEFLSTLAPKIAGLRTVLAAVDQDKIKLLVTFGSIIGRAGLRGEAHYATANDWLSELTGRFGADHPKARTIALEWSVWSGAGMGERLGVVEALTRDGITPISVDDGIAVLRRVLGDSSLPPVLVVSGRTGGLPTLTLGRPGLPLRRFLDRVDVHYPGIELITEADLSVGNDPYLADHHLDSDLLFPAVIGMEAMTQVASALTGDTGSPAMEDVAFLRPIVVRPDGSTTVRIAALVVAPGVADVVIRSEETAFGADHFRATLRWPRGPLPEESAAEPALPRVAVEPAQDLYGRILFQGARFQRLRAYRTAAARHAVAEIDAGTQTDWFTAYLPQETVLADPGTRDVAMHALQCCVPDATLLPERIDRLYLAQAAEEIDHVVLDATERTQDGDRFTYDVDLFSPSGRLLERWQGLTLRAVRRNDGSGPWVPAMLGPHLERSLERVLGGSRAVVVEPDPADGATGTAQRKAQTRLAVSRALERPVTVRYRPDGKPEVDGVSVSASHAARLTFAVAGSGRLSCDVETAVDRSDEDWAALVGVQQHVARDLLLATDDAAVANTRIWSALECLRKTGATTQSLTVETVAADRWVVLSAGTASVATWVTRMDDRTDPVVFAVLVGKEHRR